MGYVLMVLWAIYIAISAFFHYEMERTKNISMGSGGIAFAFMYLANILAGALLVALTVGFFNVWAGLGLLSLIGIFLSWTFHDIKKD